MRRINPRQQAESRWIRALRGQVARWLGKAPTRTAALRLRAAIVKLDNLGDGVLAVGAIRTLLHHYGEAECLLVVSPQAEVLMATEFPRTPRLVLPMAVMHRRLVTHGARYRAATARFDCDDVISLRHQREDWDELVMAWLNGRRSWAMEPGPGSRYFAPARTYTWHGARRLEDLSHRVGAVETCHEIERHRQLLSVVLGREIATGEIMPRLTGRRATFDEGSVVVSPFTTMAIRDFPPELVLATLRAVRGLTSTPIHLYGLPAQTTRLERLARMARDAGIQDVAVVASAPVSSYLDAVASARLIITADTATAHLATAYDRPAVVLMGGGHPHEFVPWGPARRQVWLTQELDCFGCDWRCVHPEPYCLTRVPALALTRAVNHVWDGGTKR